MRFHGAIIKEQGVTFAIVVVKKHVIDNRSRANQAIRSFQVAFPGVPIVLMAQNYRGTPTYYGRRDLVRFLRNVPLQAIPWREYRLG